LSFQELWKWNHTVSNLWGLFFHSEKFTEDLPIMCINNLLLFSCWIVSMIWTYQSLLYHSPMEEYVTYPQVFSIMNKASKDIHIQVRYENKSNSDGMNAHRNLASGLYGSCMLRFQRNFQTVFQSSCSTLYSHHQQSE
jgi:hypothetical protein